MKPQTITISSEEYSRLKEFYNNYSWLKEHPDFKQGLFDYGFWDGEEEL